MNDLGKGLRLVSVDPMRIEMVRTIGEPLWGWRIPRKAALVIEHMQRCKYVAEVYAVPDLCGCTLICVVALREDQPPLVIGWARRLRVKRRLSACGKAQLWWLLALLACSFFYCIYKQQADDLDIFELSGYIFAGLTISAAGAFVLGWLTSPTWSLIERHFVSLPEEANDP